MPHLCRKPLTETQEETPSEGKLSWQQQKEEQARKRKQENELKKVEKRIEELETRDKEIDDTLVLPDVCTNVGRCAELSREKDKIQAELEELYEKWEELAVTAIFSPNITGATVSSVDTMALLCVYSNHFFQRFSDCKDEISAVQYSRILNCCDQCKVFGHLATFNRGKGSFFQFICKLYPVSDCHPVLHVYEELLSMQKSLPQSWWKFLLLPDD